MTEEIKESKTNVAATRLPFGLCEAHGITIQKGWTPRDAWEALKGAGVVKDAPYQEYFDATPKTINATRDWDKNPITNKQDIVDFVKEQFNIELENEKHFLNDNKELLYTFIPKEKLNSIVPALKKVGIYPEEHNKGYYWLHLPSSKYNPLSVLKTNNDSEKKSESHFSDKSEITNKENPTKPMEEMTRKELISACVDDQIKRGIVKPEDRSLHINARLNGGVRMGLTACRNWYKSVFETNN